MTVTLGDLAERVAAELELEALEPITDVLDEDPLGKDNASVFSRMRFSWRSHDREILTRIRAAADSMFVELFADAISVLDTFYASLRVPELTDSGSPRIGPDGRQVFLRDERGNYIEHLGQLTGQDLDQAVLDLQRVLLAVTTQVEDLMLEALMAHNVARDVADDAWFSMVEGTQGDRTARANRESRKDRWHAFFRFYLHRRAKSFLDELNAFARRLDNIGYRQSRQG